MASQWLEMSQEEAFVALTIGDELGSRIIASRSVEELVDLLRSAARVQRTIVSRLPEMSKEDKPRVAKILDEANEKIVKKNWCRRNEPRFAKKQFKTILT